MRVRNVGSNMTELLINGYTVLFSYETPVAALTPQGYVRTSHKWSQTTTRHINKWLDGMVADEMPQDFFYNLTEEA
jgi:hypothetical protein